MPPQYRGGSGGGDNAPGTPGGVKRPRMGLSLSSGSQNEDNPVEVAAPPVSPVMSQVTSEKSRQ